MLLAELEVFHSRPIAPTRRVSIGVAALPVSPAPGFGGLLLGAVVSAFVPEVDPDLFEELEVLMAQVEAGRRIPQPRLRHRLQADRVGLNRYRHQLFGTGEELLFELDRNGAPEPNVLAAVYAAGRLPEDARPHVFTGLRRAMRWRGELGADFVEYLTEGLGGAHTSRSWTSLGGHDPVAWALGVLGLPADHGGRRVVQGRFRELLRTVHPDEVGDGASDAAQRITDLTEARRILLAD